MKEYKKLTKSTKYDKEQVDELVELMQEMIENKNRYDYLKEILDESEDLKKYVWTTADGEVKALHNIDDDHLKNIFKWLVERDMSISKEFKAEGRKRGLQVPVYDKDRGRYRGLGNLIANITASNYYQEAEEVDEF